MSIQRLIFLGLAIMGLVGCGSSPITQVSIEIGRAGSSKTVVIDDKATFTDLWNKKVEREPPTGQSSWDVLIKVHRGNRMESWRYNSKGYLVTAGLKKGPCYKLSNIEEFNKLIGVAGENSSS
jgi:hypothetical protein